MHRNRRRKGGKKRGGKKTVRTGDLTRERVPKSLAALNSYKFHREMPEYSNVLLTYTVNFTLSTAAPNFARRFNPNNAYQPDPAVTAGTVPGYADWAGLYGFYRVMGYSYFIQCSNNEAFAVTPFVLNMNADPGTASPASYAVNRNCFLGQMSAKGGVDHYRFRTRSPYTISYIVGEASPKIDDTYRAGIAAAPADLTWLAVGVSSVTGANLALGAAFTLELSLYVKFYDPFPQS